MKFFFEEVWDWFGFLWYGRGTFMVAVALEDMGREW